MCPIFGCQEQKTTKDTVLAYGNYGKKLNSFQTMQSCTAEEVEKYNYKCKVMAKRCFGNLQKDGVGLETVFQQNVCDKLRCHGGVLLGSIMDGGGSRAEDIDPHGSVIVWWIFRYLGIGIIVVFALFYALSTGLLFSNYKAKRKLKKAS